MVSTSTLPQGIAVIIPALNEESALPLVLGALPRAQLSRLIVVDNGSTDGTAAVAARSGAEVIHEPVRGYGQACQTAIAALLPSPPDIVVILDADFSDDPEDLHRLVRPLVEEEAELVLGSRVLGQCEPGALLWHARLGNRLVTGLIALFCGAAFTDLGPFRALRWEALQRLQMSDKGFGWNVEMQVKAAKRGLIWMEVPTSYRERIGVSKISGSVSGSLRAGWQIFRAFWTHAIRGSWAQQPESGR